MVELEADEPCCLDNPVAAVMVGGGSHFPRRIETLLSLPLATARSCLPSLLKSPIATESGTLPTATFVVAVKLPAPSPMRIETVLSPESATDKSCLPSLL